MNVGEPPIIGYQIQWNSGSGSTFTTLTTWTTLSNLVFTKSTSILTGVTYEFRIIATNVVGDSSPSNALAILAAQPPAAPTQLVKYGAD